MSLVANLFLIFGILILGVWALIKLKKGFSEKLFFQIGLGLFLIQGLANTWGIVIEWTMLPPYALIVKIAGTLFNFLIAYFFYYLMKKNKPIEAGKAGKMLSPEEIEGYLNEGADDGD